LQDINIWSLIVGAVFLLAALGNGPLKKWPISMPVLYLAVGVAIGPWGIGLLELDLLKDAKTIEVLTEIAVLVSLLTAGLRLSPSWSHLTRAPIPLASIGMVLTIMGIAALVYFGAGLSLGAAILLGAVLAPTDSVLASEVQVNHEDDKDNLRYALTGEAGLNDGAAFPFIMLGLGLLGVHQLGDFGWRWLAIDLLWATVAGIGCGWLSGYLISRLAVWVKRHSTQPAASEGLLTLGLIGISYGASLAISAYGFLAVFAAGVAMRRFAEDEDGEADDDHADQMMLQVIGINQRFGEILEVALVVLIGSLLTTNWAPTSDWWISLTLFALIRPVAVFTSLFRADISRLQKGTIAFFGIRGIGSMYYLTYAIEKGLDEPTAIRLGGIVLTTIALSLLIHSNAATPVLAYYTRKGKSWGHTSF
jgi:NhaP-type Na+/H+ or K+/H+ antiporter